MSRVKEYFYSFMEEYDKWADENGDDPLIRRDYEKLATKLAEQAINSYKGENNELKINCKETN